MMTMTNTGAANSNNGRSLTRSDRAAAIRSELKLHGWTSRDVSVRVDSYSLGCTIHVTIRSASVRISAVQETIAHFERVDRCSTTGEILCGGNAHLDIEYADSVRDAVAAPIAAAIPEDGSTVYLHGFVIFQDPADRDYYIAQHAGDEPDLKCWSKMHLARVLAVRILDA